MSSPLDLIKQFGEEEKKITSGKIDFISPVFNTRVVATSVKGLTYKFSISRKLEPGWYLFQAYNQKRAKVSREANPEEIGAYLKKCISIRMVVTHRVDNMYYALPQKQNKLNLSYDNPVPVLLPEDGIMDFDMIVAGFDGGNLWFESPDYKNDPTKSQYMRESFEAMLSPEKIHFSGLSFEEKKSYALRFAIDEEVKKKMKKKGIEGAIEHAGGELVSYRELKNSFSVTYKVDGSSYTSTVTKDPAHNVITAGLCLNGHDKEFDLASLVGVIREGQRRHAEDDDYEGDEGW